MNKCINSDRLVRDVMQLVYVLGRAGAPMIASHGDWSDRGLEVLAVSKSKRLNTSPHVCEHPSKLIASIPNHVGIGRVVFAIALCGLLQVSRVRVPI